MEASLVSEIWNEIKRYVNTVDRSEAAETIVSVMIDNDVDADEIRTAFKNDTDIKQALSTYLKDQEDEEYDDVEEEDEDDDDDSY
jgi:hypothetical protein